MEQSSLWEKRRKRIFTIIEIGTTGDHASRAYDFFYAFIIVLNLCVSFMYTFDELELLCGPLLLNIEAVTVAFFAADYCLRLWTAKFLYPGMKESQSIRKYMLSFSGIVDILSFLPYYLPIFFPAGAVAFRIVRVVRIFRLFRINAYYDSLTVITEVITSKRQQLFSSVFIILVLMLSSSMCMYSLEHEAQPEVFSNAFSGLWWSVSTLLTVGYGDIYPITPLGKIFGIFITFLGVGMVAIPTGIISAGFVDQYSRLKRMSEYAREEAVHFIKVHLTRKDRWVGKAIRDIGLPGSVIVAVIQRGSKIIVPRGDVILMVGDTLVLGAESLDDDKHIELKELVLQKHNPWNGMAIRDLDISRQTIIVMVERQHKMLIPKGDLILLEGDKVLLYTQSRLSEADTIQV
ncbi:MAG: ion transporter [Oscillibacter sp.]|nr:ion transporter [Oscillibacter sp.]